jgi:hypothetical protein
VQDCRRAGIIKVDLKGSGWKAVDRVNLAENRDKLRAVVSTVTNPRVG